MPLWTWAAGPGASADTPGPERELSSAYGRVVTARTSSSPVAQFTIKSSADEFSTIRSYESDVWVYRGDDFVFRGRILGGQPTDETGESFQFNVAGYRGMLGLAAKVEPPVPVFTNHDQGDIAWLLVQGWQLLPGGDWGITNGLGAFSGTTRDDTDILPGTPVAEVIDRIAQRDDGYEWDISPQLSLDRWYPQRGTDNGFVADYGGTVAKFSMSPGEFGNVAVVTGGQGTTAVVSAHPSLTGDQRGRWTVAQGFPSVTLQSTVDAKAAWLASQSVTIESKLALELTPGRWAGPTDLWIGDTAHVRINSGRLAINAPFRVLELQAVCGDDGTETITVGVAGDSGDALVDPNFALARYVRSLERRLGELERNAA